MSPGQSDRIRGRQTNRGREPNPLNRSYDSHGPDVRIRRTAQHVAEKYLQLARDAHTGNDPVAAEDYLQHAEHYFRLIAAAQAVQIGRQNGDVRAPGESDPQDSDDSNDFGGLPDRHFFATLFNSGGFSLKSGIGRNSYVGDRSCAFGSQTLLFSCATAQHFLRCWSHSESMHDIKMFQLASMLGPIYCHNPSLVQHMSVPSTWGGPYARAYDFLTDWKAVSY